MRTAAFNAFFIAIDTEVFWLRRRIVIIIEDKRVLL
jgi:hypothetical protein